MLFGQVLDWRLAVDPGQKKTRQQFGRPAVNRLARLPIDTSKISFSETVECDQQPRNYLRHPQTFEKQVVETEGEVESGVAEPGAFRVDKDRANRTDQYVFRADIAMDERQFCVRRGFGELFKHRGTVGMRPRRCQ